ISNVPSETISQEFTFASRQHERFSYILGVTALRFNEEYAPNGSHVANNGPITALSYYDYLTTSYAAFGELTYNITDKLILVGGVRYIKDNKKKRWGCVAPPIMVRGKGCSFGDNSYDYWSPRASLRYKITERSNIYATYSTGFKTAGYSSAGFNGEIVEPET